MSYKEERRRALASSVFRQAWKYFRRSLISFSQALLLAWKTLRGRLRLVYSKIRGTCANNPDGTNRQRILSQLLAYPEQAINLRFQREPNNAYDHNAIAIIAEVHGKGSACVGYLSASLAREVADILDEGSNTEVVFFLGITGVGKANLGVNFCFTILPISIYHLEQKVPQMAY